MRIPILHFAPNASVPATASIVHTAVGPFSLEIDVADPRVIHLIFCAIGAGDTHALWVRQFGDIADRDAVLERFHSGELDLIFFGRVTIIFGSAAIIAATDSIIDEEREIRQAQLDAEAQRQNDRRVINLYSRDTKRGFHLDLERRNEETAEWSVRYDRASERDRLRDWTRWQKPRFADFLDYAAELGPEELTRLLIDEMFETERRVKKEGRGAGGLRPLRMWRGD